MVKGKKEETGMGKRKRKMGKVKWGEKTVKREK